MKRGLILAMTAFAAMLLASCQKGQSPSDGETLSLSVALPQETITRSISDGKKVDQLLYEVYCDDLLVQEGEGRKVSELEFKVETKLVRNVEYTILFWAQKSGTSFYDATDLRAIKADYSGLSNEEGRDAFYGHYTLTMKNEALVTETVYLSRPFAQINFGASMDDWSLIQPFLKNTSLRSQVSFTNVPDLFNAADGSVSTSAEAQEKVVLTYSAAPCERDAEAEGYGAEITANSTTYAWVAMNYLFAPKGDSGEITTVTAEFLHDKNTEQKPLRLEVPNVPYRANYKTNIVGDLFSENVTINIEVKPGFTTPDNEKTIK